MWDAIKIPAGNAVRLPADDDLGVGGVVAHLHGDARGPARGVGQGRIVAGDDQPGVDTRANADVANRFARHGQGGLHGAPGCLFVGPWIAKIRQQAAAVRAHDVSAMVFDEGGASSLGRLQ